MASMQIIMISKISVDHNLNNVTIVVIMEGSSPESLSQISHSWNESIWVEYSTYKWQMETIDAIDKKNLELRTASFRNMEKSSGYICIIS